VCRGPGPPRIRPGRSPYAAWPAGVRPPRNFGPGEFDLTPAINRNGRNILTLSGDNSSITELGTGGLVRPALIYAPKGSRFQAITRSPRSRSLHDFPPATAGSGKIYLIFPSIFVGLEPCR
jgi:hypothetical protein